MQQQQNTGLLRASSSAALFVAYHGWCATRLHDGNCYCISPKSLLSHRATGAIVSSSAYMRRTVYRVQYLVFACMIIPVRTYQDFLPVNRSPTPTASGERDTCVPVLRLLHVFDTNDTTSRLLLASLVCWLAYVPRSHPSCLALHCVSV